MALLKYNITAQSETATRTRVKANNFEFIIDEPKNAGGSDLGPNPVQYLIGALSGCMSIVCRMVASEMGITVNSLSLEIEGDLDTDKFTGKSSAGRSGYTEIRVRIIADTDADAATKLQWMKAVKERCPVSDNISNVTPVKLILS